MEGEFVFSKLTEQVRAELGWHVFPTCILCCYQWVIQHLYSSALQAGFLSWSFMEETKRLKRMQAFGRGISLQNLSPCLTGSSDDTSVGESHTLWQSLLVLPQRLTTGGCFLHVFGDFGVTWGFSPNMYWARLIFFNTRFSCAVLLYWCIFKMHQKKLLSSHPQSLCFSLLYFWVMLCSVMLFWFYAVHQIK